MNKYQYIVRFESYSESVGSCRDRWEEETFQDPTEAYGYAKMNSRLEKSKTEVVNLLEEKGSVYERHQDGNEVICISIRKITN